MKRWILTAAVTLLLAGGVQAQTSEKKTTKKQATGTNKAKAKKAKGAKKSTATYKAKGVKATSPKLNERRIYKAKNGQRATPTGHEATPTSGGYASLKKDTTVIIPKETPKAKKEKGEQ